MLGTDKLTFTVSGLNIDIASLSINQRHTLGIPLRIPTCLPLSLWKSLIAGCIFRGSHPHQLTFKNHLSSYIARGALTVFGLLTGVICSMYLII